MKETFDKWFCGPDHDKRPVFLTEKMEHWNDKMGWATNRHSQDEASSKKVLVDLILSMVLKYHFLFFCFLFSELGYITVFKKLICL